MQGSKSLRECIITAKSAASQLLTNDLVTDIKINEVWTEGTCCMVHNHEAKKVVWIYHKLSDTHMIQVLADWFQNWHTPLVILAINLLETIELKIDHLAK